jgi:anthranilate/para-aminobenzoate synthase component II
MRVGRYHSLAIEPATLPAELQVSARTDDGEIMAVRAPALRLTGVQFHPESILTPDGDQLLANFLGVALGPVQPSRVLADVEA